jgi:hypothetical protein
MFVGRNDRKTSRHALRIPCQVVREDDFQLVGERTIDVSSEGMLVRSDADVAIGDHVIVAFQATPLGLWFESEAKVTRIVRGRRPGDNGRALGLRFTDMAAISRLILRGHLRRVPPPVPRRARRIDYAATVHKIAAA